LKSPCGNPALARPYVIASSCTLNHLRESSNSDPHPSQAVFGCKRALILFVKNRSVRGVRTREHEDRLRLIIARLLPAFLGILSFSALATADTLVVGSPATGITLTIKDSALTTLNSSWAGGVAGYIDPYHGTLNGNAVLLFCIDPDHLDNTSSSGYQVTISSNGTGSSTMQALNLAGAGILPSSGTLSTAALAAGFTSASQLYGGMAWLSQQLLASSSALSQQEYQAAIWQLGDYTSTFAVVNPPSGFDSSLVTTLEHQAQLNSSAVGFEVLTDSKEVANGIHAGQEYLVLTPEPNSALLAASGLIGFGYLRRRSKFARAKKLFLRQ
jgi:hypothetical protein